MEADSPETSIDQIVMKLTLKYPSLTQSPIAVWVDGKEIGGHIPIEAVLQASRQLLM